MLLGALPASAETADGGLGPIPQRSAAQRSVHRVPAPVIRLLLRWQAIMSTPESWYNYWDMLRYAEINWSEFWWWKKVVRCGAWHQSSAVPLRMAPVISLFAIVGVAMVPCKQQTSHCDCDHPRPLHHWDDKSSDHPVPQWMSGWWICSGHFCATRRRPRENFFIRTCQSLSMRFNCISL